ncbi:MAG TPA: potassium channel family protein [Pyrinomonadaceae bacterium]|nr:potassium channel family protein [Pyrinomonadaceae bacterium]
MLRELAFAFVMVAVCVVIHTTGLVIFFEWLGKRRALIEQHSSMLSYALLLILVFAVIILLHLADTGIWAAFYYWRNLFLDFETSFYFSLGSYTTIGYGDVVLPKPWRLLGGIEGVSGVLLCGLSTAFIFAIVNVLFRIRIQKQSHKIGARD